MTEVVFAAEPSRLLIAVAAGIVLLLLLIIKFKLHPVLSLLISAMVIGLGAGMPVPTLVSTVEKGAGETLQGIVLLIGLGSLFGGSPVYLAAMVCAINGGATAFSHVNDSGFWLVSSLLEIDEKTTLKSWTMMETIIGFTGLICAIVISLFA